MSTRTYPIITKLFPAVAIFILLCVYKAKAQGDLLVTPKRVVFEGTKRSHELNIANIGADTATYVISFIQYKMKEDGSFEIVTQPDSAQSFADKNLRFYPRTVTLAPKEAQTVKVQVTKSNELKPGEYRSHIYFRSVPKEAPLGEREPVKDSTISIKLVPVYGLSVPAIIRVGTYNSRITFSDVSLQTEKDTSRVLKLKFNRTGSMSTYGDVSVDHIAKDGTVTRIGLIKGLAVYTPTPARTLNLALDNKHGINFHSGRLHVVYNDQSAEPIKYAEYYLALK